MVQVSDKTAISMPIRNLIGVVSVVVVGVWAYFGIIERLNNIETNLKLYLEVLNYAASKTKIYNHYE